MSEPITQIQSPAGRRKDPRERFLDVAPKRTQKVLDALRHLSKCGNRATYHYEREEVAKIFKAIEDELTRARNRFDGEEQTTFKL